MSPRTLLAVSLVSGASPLAEQVAQARAGGAELIELRVDRIGDIGAIEELLRAGRDVPIILTIRSGAEGGAWDGDDDERVALYERLGLLLPGLVDVELHTWERSANLRQKIGLIARTLDVAAKAEVAGASDHAPGVHETPAEDSPAGAHAAAGATSGGRPRNELILSRHDLRRTPPDLGSAFAQLLGSRAPIIKGAFAAADATDALRILSELRRSSPRRATIALALGEAGVITRVLGPKFGAFLVFAALQAGQEAAPGQTTLDELVQRYRWRGVNAETQVYGLVGWPVAHSQSPRVHNAALGARGINAVYLPLPVRPTYDDFARFLDYVDANRWLDFRGLSVTVPHKEHAVRWLDAQRASAPARASAATGASGAMGASGAEISPLARRCGAVNTLTRRDDGSWLGDNTDAPGITHALSAAILPGRSALILGAGGVGRAAGVALLEAGCAVTIVNRSPQRAAALARELGTAAAPWEDRASIRADIVVNATTVGMTPSPDESPLPAAALRRGQWVLDTVYTPAQTRLLREAAAAGCRAIGGALVFQEQAARQFTLWHGVPMPRDA